MRERGDPLARIEADVRLRAVGVLNLRELTTGVIGQRPYVRRSLGRTAQGIGKIIDAPTRGVGEACQKVVIVVVKTERVDGVPNPSVWLARLSFSSYDNRCLLYTSPSPRD